MKILVLGGTAWLGGYVAATALQRGHDVTCLARGKAGRPPECARFIRANRENPDAYDEVERTGWDAVVDVSRRPGQVKSAAAILSGRSKSFILVSSCNVYADHASPGQDESAALLSPLPTDVMETTETYGEAKVACEQAVLAAFGPARSMIVRSGLIGGPGDISHRSGYWPRRFARPSNEQGRVLVPATPSLATQMVDVRDLANWIIDSAKACRSGIFNAVGEMVFLEQHLNTARKVAGHRGELVFRSSEWLLAQNVNPWMGERSIPLWLPTPDYAGFCARHNSAARAAGLAMRPLRETLADTLAWEFAANLSGPRQAGLSDEDERFLLEAAL